MLTNTAFMLIAILAISTTIIAAVIYFKMKNLSKVAYLYQTFFVVSSILLIFSNGNEILIFFFSIIFLGIALLINSLMGLFS